MKQNIILNEFNMPSYQSQNVNVTTVGCFCNCVMQILFLHLFAVDVCQHCDTLL